MEKIIIATDRKTLSEVLNDFFIPKDQVSEKKEFDFNNEKLNRREAARFLDVSYQTIGNWTNAGILKKHGYGRKKFYLRHELIAAMDYNR